MAIIGISGKIGAGKDTVAELIKRIDRKEVHGYHHDEVDETEIIDNGVIDYVNKWQIKKFATKLKVTASLLLNVPLEMFEDRNFKESVLPKQWNTFSIDWGYGGINTGNYSTREEAIEIATVNGAEKYNIVENTMTVRKFMQLLGTEAGRYGLHPNVWVNALFSEYKPVAERISVKQAIKEGYIPESTNIFQNVQPDWIITDVRFPNEVAAIRERDGIIVRINRPNNPFMQSDHLGETALDNYQFDYVIDNNGSIDSLKDNVSSFVEFINDKTKGFKHEI